MIPVLTQLNTWTELLRSPVTFGLALVILSYIIATITGKMAAQRWQGSQRKVCFASQLIAAVSAITSTAIHGTSMTSIQGLAICGIFLYASYSDIKTRELDDWVSVMLFLSGFIGRHFSTLPEQLISGILVSGLMLVVVYLSKGNGLGGADVKFAAAASFVLGLQRSLIGTIIGMTVAVVHNLIKRKKKKTDGSFPLVPYLSAGYMLAFYLK